MGEERRGRAGVGRGGEGEWGRGRHVVRKACDASLTGSSTTIFSFLFLLLQQLVGARYFYFLFKAVFLGVWLLTALSVPAVQQGV